MADSAGGAAPKSNLRATGYTGLPSLAVRIWLWKSERAL
jgi:hypothetical protein